MEQRKRLGVMVFIWVLLSAWLQIPHVMGDEVTDVVIDELTTGARMGHGDMAPCGMENYRLDKKDWSREEYFDCVKTKGAYQELRGLPLPHHFGHLSSCAEAYNVCVLPCGIVSEASIQYIFDKAIYDYDNCCPSGTEKGVMVTFLFVSNADFSNMVEKYYEKTGVVLTGILIPATTPQNREFLEYITTELREKKVGVVTKLLLESDSSYEQEVNKVNHFLLSLIMDSINAFSNLILHRLLDDCYS